MCLLGMDAISLRSAVTYDESIEGPILVMGIE